MLRGLPARPSRAFVLLPEGSPAEGLSPPVVVLRGGHPYPTRAGVAATCQILEAVRQLRAGERLLFLLSGGASALLEAPAGNLSFEDLVATYRALVASGLPIASINLVRGCLSAVKGGALAEAAYPAAVTTLAISDVELDDPAVIGSGPTVPPAEPLATRCRRAVAVLTASGVDVPPAVRTWLAQQVHRTIEPQVPPAMDFTVIASVADAVSAATGQLERRGYSITPGSGYELRSDTAAAARRIVDVAQTLATEGKRQAFVFGGETTVALSAPAGRGGRNLDLAARVACALRGQTGVAVLAAGTDGADGSSKAAGAVVDGGSFERAERCGRSLEAALAAFDTEAALEASGDLIVTGPTGTNVGDLVVVVAG